MYLDTSSAIKLYVAEAGSDDVNELVRGAAVVATSAVTHAEARAALARLRREGSSFAEVARRAGPRHTQFSSFDDCLNDAAGRLARMLRRRR